MHEEGGVDIVLSIKQTSVVGVHVQGVHVGEGHDGSRRSAYKHAFSNNMNVV